MVKARSTTSELAEALANDADCQVLDVREPAEYQGGHIPGSALTPLSNLDRALVALDPHRRTYVVCRSGQRAQHAAKRMNELGWTDVRVLEGGIQAWARACRPVEGSRRAPWSLDRQVRFTAGSLAAAGVLGAVAVHPAFMAIPGLVGAGLVVSALTDTCAMGSLLARMPWNQSGATQDACAYERSS